MLAAWVTVEMYRDVSDEHRGYLTVWATAVGAGCVMALRWWIPENTFQAIAVSRQYGLIFLFGGACCVNWWLSEEKRSEKPHRPLRSRQREIWPFWLLAGFLAGIATKGGLLWLFVGWEGAGEIWRAWGDVMLLSELVISIAWLRSIPAMGASIQRLQDGVVRLP